MSTRAAQRRSRPTGQVGGPQPAVGAATGVASLVTLMVLTFGVPAALWVFGRDLVPSTVVKPSVMWDALRRPDDGHLFLQGLYLAAWVGWFLFFMSVFLEIVAQVRHRAALRLPGLGWLQRGVGTLVTAAVVIVASPVAAMADAPGDLHAGGGVVATQAVVHGADGYGVARGGTVRETEMDNPTYTVRPGDSLWRIAQEQLGDPNRFADIAKLNDGRVMPGGTVFHFSEFLQAGWVLIMPADMGSHSPQVDAATNPPAGSAATSGPQVSQQADVPPVAPPAAAPAPPPSATKTYTVRQGDSLSSIAKAVLGDARRWDELFELNRGRPQAGGPPIWRADLIWPGDVLVLPDDAEVGPGSGAGPLTLQPSTQAPERTSTPSFHQRLPQVGEDPPVVATPVGQVPSQAPSQSPNQPPNQPPGANQGTPSLRTGEPIPGDPPPQTQPGAPASDPSQNGNLPQPGLDHPAEPAAPETVTFSDTVADSGKTMAAIGGLLAAGLLSTLAAKRLRRLMQRRAGERIAVRQPDKWELELSTVENPTGRVFIDAALRTLSAKLAEVDRILPDISATVLKPHGLEVHLSRNEPPIAPFYADAQRPGVWICPLGAPLTATTHLIPQAPYPALVSLGFDEGDDAVLVDLESTRGVSLLAPVEESVAMLRAMAVELATGTWADQVEVTLVGFGAELPPLFEPGCLVHTASLPRAVEAVARWSATVDAVLDKHDVSLREARTYPDAELAQITKTRILLSAVPLDPRSAYQLRQLLSGRQRTSMAVVAVVQEPEHVLSPWAVTGPMFHTPVSQAPGSGIKVRMQALRDEQYAAIVRDLSGDGLDDEWASVQQDGALDADGARAELPSGGGRKGRAHAARKQLPPGPVRTALPHRVTASLEAASAPGASPVEATSGATGATGATGSLTTPAASSHSTSNASEPPRAKPLTTPEPKHANRFRVPVEDLFRIQALPPVPGSTPDAPVPLPKPGAAKHARHALNPANLPQFDLVVAPWHGRTGTESITAVPNGTQDRAQQPQPLALGLTTLAGAGALAEAPPRPQDRLAGLALESIATATQEKAPDIAAPSRKPGQWQNAYWNQRKAAEAEKQTFDPATMGRSINVLGPIELSGTAAAAGSPAADLAEVAAFIVLHPGCSAAQIAAELWPGRKGAVAIRDAQVARLKEWLGTDAYGEPHLRVTPHGYAMGPSVTCDWVDFVWRVQSGELVNAISLVRGRPFEDAPLRRYGWAEALRHEMSALIIDTAHYVAEACLAEQNPRGAQSAAYRGLQGAPESELLYRDLLTALAALGDLSSARQHADTLIAYADREGIDLQPETTALLRDVLQAVPGV